jgi:hypothetical protein
MGDLGNFMDVLDIPCAGVLVSSFEKQIDQMVYKLYGLIPAKIAIIQKMTLSS